MSTQVVEPGQVDVFRQTAEPTLTLITCTPDLVYSHRLIVTALLVATAPV
ncbi:MAG: sortase domain-bontaining protein [Dehalococcoidia bacterium]